MKKFVFGVALAAILSGCASNPERQARIAHFHATTPVCSGQEQCDAMWEYAQVWVASNGRMKIQTATNVLIETYGSRPNSPDLAIRVLKEPQGNGRYRIVFSGGCNNIFGCVPDAIETGIRFNEYINNAAQ